MKKFLLLTLLSLMMSSVTFAQKNYKKQAQSLVKKYKPIIRTPKGERSAAYLVDSSKLKFHDSGDSTLVFSFKFKYNPNGTVKNEETFIDFFGLFEAYEKSNYFYNAAKPLLINYKDLFLSQDQGITYDKVGVDSFFYEAKDRLVLNRTRDIIDKSVVAYTSYKYKTAFETADTIRTYGLDELEENLIPDAFTYNTLDAKGNVTVAIELGIDFATEEFGLSTKTENKYNTQNQVTEQLSSDWDADNKIWEIRSKTLNRYNTNGTLKNSIFLSDYDSFANDFMAKDSTSLAYNTKGQAIQSDFYEYDFSTKTYDLTSKDVNKYDANGNNTRTEGYSPTEADPTVLELGLSIDNWYSLYKDAVATKDLFSKDFEIVVANPIGDNQALTLNSKLEGAYTLLAYDLNGKVISSQMIKNNQTIMTQLPAAGTYIFFVTDSQNLPLAMKKVVKM